MNSIIAKNVAHTEFTTKQYHLELYGYFYTNRFSLEHSSADDPRPLAAPSQGPESIARFGIFNAFGSQCKPQAFGHLLSLPTITGLAMLLSATAIKFSKCFLSVPHPQFIDIPRLRISSPQRLLSA